MSVVKKIVIFGGGTSGWLAALYLVKNLRTPIPVKLIEDTSIGPIGVGEGTQPFTAKFLYDCGLPLDSWMKDCNAVFKLGVEMVGWADQTYFVDNDNLSNHFITPEFFTSDYFVGKDPQEFIDWLPSYNLAKGNKSQKINPDLDCGINIQPPGCAVHFSASEIVKVIKNHIINDIEYVDTKIIEVKSEDREIKGLVDINGNTHTADLYIDCTGFKGILIGETLKTPFVSYTDYLPCDRAIAIPSKYQDPEKECHPYTRATTMSAGWRWTIPIFNRIGNGYVYSSKFISDDDAEKELREAIGEFDAPALKLKMKCGRHQNITGPNVCAIGLSAGFVEPLEATGITFTTAAIRNLTVALNSFNNVWGPYARHFSEEKFKGMVTEILAFVWAHYHFSKRDDTPFWKNIRSQQIDDLPEDARKILNAFYPEPCRRVMYDENSFFHTVHWFSIINAGGGYKEVVPYLSEDQEKYGKYFTESVKARIELAKEIFPDHYEYLKNRYSK